MLIYAGSSLSLKRFTVSQVQHDDHIAGFNLTAATGSELNYPAFRFRSDFAREIDYLSKISKEEMAALNFTLDESQNLKGLYQETIRRGDHENVDTISGLGELYEFDQDFEIARNYYRRAIAVLDASFRDSIASSMNTSGMEVRTASVKSSGSAVNIETERTVDDDKGNEKKEIARTDNDKTILTISFQFKLSSALLMASSSLIKAV